MNWRHPRSVITDGDVAMRKAIRKVMPGTNHRLCSWHIEQNMVRHLRGPMLTEFRKFIYYPMEEYEFEIRWARFVEKHEITDKNVWISKMYKLRKKCSKEWRGTWSCWTQLKIIRHTQMIYGQISRYQPGKESSYVGCHSREMVPHAACSCLNLGRTGWEKSYRRDSRSAKLIHSERSYHARCSAVI
ncbi:protein FAR1-RELATED SEQUENCE 7-like [Brachypodium distachyon]|uniref:protein FAR1-RELATED SEQUENCE 7-like n=1 Tax=Brachypodium distachyon TaxID=15368 RepID=UPI00053000B8|nr:protein FAR1-RELATED SEQUENCE 7-like [Brachypodium distachyon]|eukprot:XP_014755939.2 protein FAR1-RELATED SEQUENCE 7-like [Brachypodium distachyon]